MNEGRHPYHPDAETIRRRISPRSSDFAYLHMIDLKRAIADPGAGATGVWLDFGCGGSPYRPLFSGVSRYLRADVAGEDLDITVRPPEALDLPDGSVDGIVSTQVLEHVWDIDWYLRECHRVLVPGGRLILTTHGTWADHFWPEDYRRWTTNGLRGEVEQRGFVVQTVRQVTSGMRAVITLWELKGRVALRGEGAALRFLLLGSWGCYKVLRPILNRFLDQTFANEAIQNQHGDTEGSVYIGLLVEATRP